MVLQAYFFQKYIDFIERNKCIRSVNILMATLSGNPHAYNTKVEVIKGIKVLMSQKIFFDIW